ncbi:MAG: imidazole glycerol phosphate synthase subunit HisH, partial [Bacteroidia bacterium]|nr:imidazole glycerol phosphate synthase subunit HisH [Bacteroidia bacterium]
MLTPIDHMNVSIIKYNAGNIRSVLFALERIGIQANVSDDPDVLRASDKIIFPGVGEAASAMQYLREHQLDRLIVSLNQPLLGICLGMQLLCLHSEEGDTDCLGIFDTRVKSFSSSEKKADETRKVPHMGWNNIYDLSTELYQSVRELTPVYFVHGYYAELSAQTIAKADYGIEYSASLKR